MINKIFLLSCVSVFTTYAQSIDYKTLCHQPGANFFEVVSQAREEFNLLKEKGPLTRAQEKAEKQLERWAYNWKNKVGADGKLPSMSENKSASNAAVLGSTKKRRSSKNAEINTWEQIGPVANPTQNGYISYPGKGRVNVIAEDPNNTAIMYVGSASGGVWKTTDDGSTWEPLTDSFAGLGVTDILVDPNNTNIVYVATGDENAGDVSSIGLYKSTNGGRSWAATGLSFLLSEEEFIRDIAFQPGNSNVIFALTNDDIKFSTNGGTSFRNANVSSPFGDTNERFQTIVFDPINTNNIVVSDYYGGIYLSKDFGENFELHRVFEGETQPSVLKLSTTADDTTHFYGITEKGEFQKYRFNMNNTASDRIFSNPIADYNSNQGYNMSIAISPTNKNNVIVGGVNGYISTNNGASFSLVLNAYDEPRGVGFYVHPDHHHLSFLADGITVLDGHDGGIHKGIFNGAANTWVDLSSGLVITQSYNIAITQSLNGDDFMMANQDNDGYSKVEKNGVRQWVSATAGDGTATGINFNNTNVRYLGSTKGLLRRTNDGYASRYDSARNILESDTKAAFVSPMVVHPVTPTTIYAAHNDLKKSTNQGNDFTALNTGLETIDFVEVVTNESSSVIYVINEEGKAKRSDNDGASWNTVNSPSGQIINSFAATPNSNIVYATVRGYSDGNKVYRSANRGRTWANISNGLPNIIMNEVILKVDSTNETLYVGTELGVYTWDNVTNNWSKMDNGLPNVRVNDLKINYTDQDLYAGTFGRGMWRVNIEEDVSLNVTDLTLKNEDLPVVYPNPITDGTFRVNITSDKATYTIYSVLGGQMKKGKIVDNEKIEVSNLSKGVYLLKVFLGDKSLNYKLVIQ